MQSNLIYLQFWTLGLPWNSTEYLWSIVPRPYLRQRKFWSDTFDPQVTYCVNSILGFSQISTTFAKKKSVGHFWRVELASFWKWIMIMYACHQVFFIINSRLCVAQRRELQFSVQSNRYCAVIMGNLSHGKV